MKKLLTLCLLGLIALGQTVAQDKEEGFKTIFDGKTLEGFTEDNIKELRKEAKRALRFARPLSLLFLDLDGFKQVNDTYGHHIGDHALREVAAVLQSSMRPYDVCVRYAGDEFVVVLGQCSRADAEAKCAELQRLLDSIEIEIRAGKVMRLAVSAGVAVYPQDGDTCEALIAEADGRMYRDKAARRMPVSQFGPAVISIEPSDSSNVPYALVARVG